MEIVTEVLTDFEKRKKMTEDKEKEHLTLINGGGEKDAVSSETFDFLVEEASLALLARWFPKNPPTDEVDYQKWVEIAVEDATAVITHLIEKKFIGEDVPL
jgi:hypothetical protein